MSFLDHYIALWCNTIWKFYRSDIKLILLLISIYIINIITLISRLLALNITFLELALASFLLNLSTNGKWKYSNVGLCSITWREKGNFAWGFIHEICFFFYLSLSVVSFVREYNERRLLPRYTIHKHIPVNCCNYFFSKSV